MDLGLKGRRALVTGSTQGIGFAIAAALAREGAAVVVNGRQPARVEAAVARIRDDGGAGEVSGVAADLGTAEGCAAVVRQVPDVDILVNNAGIFEPRPFAEIADAEWDRMLAVNLMSGVRLSRHYFPRMLERDWGRVVFVSSESGVQIPAEMIHYGVSKTAQIALARGMAELTAGTRVTVNSVLPGPTASEGVSTFVAQVGRSRGLDAQQMEQEFFRSVRPSSLIKRFATPEEVAATVVFVCSARASAVNGAALRADGGVVRAIL
ncbi:MAG: SDR family oxidoreductase [Rhodospirillaceae bacterium]|nr:SDR family oxidoreductase [Rhodospirillaceae bacterium]